jgi:NADH-quinone oxidoreductase subunit C
MAFSTPVPETDILTPVPTIFGDWLTRFGEAWKTQTERLRERFSDAVEEIRMPGVYPTDVPIVYVRRDKVIDVLKLLKEELEYSFLADITATDEEADPRFEIVYNLFSVEKKYRLRVKTRVPEGADLATATGLWKGADWMEREVYDMFGVRFRGHPDLRRILMDERWVGHPLRKDYPLKGYQLFPEPEQIHRELLD